MQKGSLSMPVAIVIAGIVIAVAIFASGRGGETTNNVANNNGNENAQQEQNTGNSNPQASNVRSVDADDHIDGPLNARVKIIEFSDYDCPFCGRVHPTLKRVRQEFGDDVAWVFRHLPLTQIHPNAPFIAEASECAAEQGGNEGFWAFTDAYFEGKIGADLSGVTEATGLNLETLRACAESGKYADAVQQDIDDALASGGRGTPYAIIVGPNDQYVSLSGAQPYEAWSVVIQQMLAS